MEHLDPPPHTALAAAANMLSYPLREPVIRTQPKSQCSHCCVHRNYVNIPCESARRLTSCTCTSSYCSRQHYSSYTPPFYHHHGNCRGCPERGCPERGCDSHIGCDCRSRTQIQSPPQFDHTSIYCSCYHCQRTRSGEVHLTEPPRTSRIHLATNNITYPTPYYATSLAPFNGMHSSWEPTFHREYRTRQDSALSSSEEVHSHVHHHVTRNPTTTCFENRTPFTNTMPAFFTTSSRVFRRNSTRLSSHPYPSLLHYPYPSLRRVCGVTFLPPRNTEILGEIEIEPFDGDWIDNERRSIEPKMLSKDEIQKLPKYIVTKETMKDFTDGERCVVCMSDFDVGEDLRILPCAHEFHASCVDKWLQTNATCPICRSTVEVT